MRDVVFCRRPVSSAWPRVSDGNRRSTRCCVSSRGFSSRSLRKVAASTFSGETACARAASMAAWAPRPVSLSSRGTTTGSRAARCLPRGAEAAFSAPRAGSTGTPGAPPGVLHARRCRRSRRPVEVDHAPRRAAHLAGERAPGRSPCLTRGRVSQPNHRFLVAKADEKNTIRRGMLWRGISRRPVRRGQNGPAHRRVDGRTTLGVMDGAFTTQRMPRP